MDDRQIAIHGADDRHQVKDVARTAPVGQRNDDELVYGIAEQPPKLRDPVVVGAISAADGNRPLVEPHDVASFEPARRLNRAGDRVAERAKRGFLRRGFAEPLRLPHAAEDHAAIADDGRVPHVDRIQPDAAAPRKHVHVRAARAERVGEPFVLVDRALVVRRRGEAQRAPLRRDGLGTDERVARVLQHEPRDRTDFRLSGCCTIELEQRDMNSGMVLVPLDGSKLPILLSVNRVFLSRGHPHVHRQSRHQQQESPVDDLGARAADGPERVGERQPRDDGRAGRQAVAAARR